MTREEKDLLLKDLCARLPYGVKVNEGVQGDFTLIGLTNERVFTTCEVEGYHNDFPIELIKPYLFSISSMTMEQIEKYTDLCMKDTAGGIYYFTPDSIDWLNKNHFDWRGLIGKGLAINATRLNIY